MGMLELFEVFDFADYSCADLMIDGYEQQKQQDRAVVRCTFMRLILPLWINLRATCWPERVCTATKNEDEGQSLRLNNFLSLPHEDKQRSRLTLPKVPSPRLRMMVYSPSLLNPAAGELAIALSYEIELKKRADQARTTQQAALTSARQVETLCPS